MPDLTWDGAGKRIFETGVDRCVLYLNTQAGNYGVAWSGVTAIEETSSDVETNDYYFNGVKYYQERAAKEYTATLRAYTYPDEFLPFDGFAELVTGIMADEQDTDDTFCLSYRTLVGDDLHGDRFAYKIHILYNLRATPSNRKYSTQGQSADPNDFAWDLSGTPAKISDTFLGTTDAIHFVIDSRYISAGTLANIEKVLYGNAGVSARLPDPKSLAKMIFFIQDNGDGTMTITGDDSIVSATTSTEYSINWPGMIFQGDTVTILDDYKGNSWVS